MRWIKSIQKAENGFTLIEVIVAMAIIGIVALSVLSIFTNGFSWITLAGDKSEAGFETQRQTEIVLNQKDSDPSPSNLTITFSSDSSTITALGNVETLSQPIRTGSVSITVFQPKY
ncbi:type II secretion system protein [Gudongella oleilytica]|uniref:type II secretion system protein n=1 Tax=Gudongella oleilytica TaxID=1582259 RepID=UPI000FF8963E|nr:type II secretion system protein [Gudongella oleilytica]